MSLYIDCDWCGTSLYGVDMATLPVTITRETTWREDTRPSLHFCVAPVVDTDRMGLPDDSGDDAATCLGKALTAIRGHRLEAPALGLEWRLVPTSDATTPHAAQAGCGLPMVADSRDAARQPAVAEQWEAWEAQRRRIDAIIDGPDGIDVLDFPRAIRQRLIDAHERRSLDTLTVSGLRDLAARDALRGIHDIGPSREAAILQALDRQADAAAAERTLQDEVRPTTDPEGA